MWGVCDTPLPYRPEETILSNDRFIVDN